MVGYRSRKKGANPHSGPICSGYLATLGIAFAQVDPGWWDGVVGEVSVAPFKWMWMLALGVLITQANTVARKGLITGLFGCLVLVACSRLPYVVLFDPFDGIFFASVPVLLWVERVPVPRLLQRPLVGIASATLFIYIVNYSVIYRLMPHLGLPAWWPVQVGVAIASGILTKMVWDRFTAGAISLFKRSNRRFTAGVGWSLKTRQLGPAPTFVSPDAM